MNLGHPKTPSKFKSKEIVDTDSSSDSENDEVIDDNDVESKKAPKKRAKGKAFTKEGVKGFTDAEIRR